MTDEDDFLDHITHSTTNRANLEDSDLEDADEGYNNKRKNSRYLSYTPEQLDMFSVISSCAVLLQETTSTITTSSNSTTTNTTTTATTTPIATAYTMTSLIDTIFTIEKFNQTIPLHTNTLTKLHFSHIWTSSSPSGAASLYLLHNTNFVSDYGALAYLKVLYILHNILSNPKFYQNNNTTINTTMETELNIILTYILPIDNNIYENYLIIQYKCRKVQLLCINYILHYCNNITTIKNHISTLYLTYFTDNTIQIRLLTAQLLPIVINLYKNKNKVFHSFINNTNIMLNTTSNTLNNNNNSMCSENPLEVIALAEGILGMASCTVCIYGSSDNILVQYSILYILQLFHSRHIVNSSERVNYSVLLYSYLSRLARRLYYSDVSLLLNDSIRWVLYQWLQFDSSSSFSSSGNTNGSSSQNASSSQNKGSAASTNLTLINFPYELLSTIQPYNTTSTSSNPVCSNTMSEYSSTLLPLICRLDSSQYRWACMLAYTTATATSTSSTTTSSGNTATDQDIAVLLKHNIFSIKALELTLSSAALQRDQLGLNYEIDSSSTIKSTEMLHLTCVEKARSISQSMHDFVIRSCNTNEISSYLYENITNLVLEVVLLQLKGSIDDYESSGDISLYSIIQLTTVILEQVCKITHILTLSELFEQCNLLYILSQVYIHMVESRRIVVHTAGLAFIHILLTNLPLQCNKSILNSILYILHTTIAIVPINLSSIIEVFSCVVTQITEKRVKVAVETADTNPFLPSPTNTTNTTTTTIDTSTSRAYTSIEIMRFVPELFAECILLLKYIAVQLGKQEAAMNAILGLRNSNKLDRNSTVDDDFVLAYYSTASNIASSSGSTSSSTTTTTDTMSTSTATASTASESNILDVATILQPAVASVHNLLTRILHHCSKTNNTSLLTTLLPLPPLYFQSCLQQQCEVYIDTTTICVQSIESRIQSLTALIDEYICGLPVTLSLIWLKVSLIFDLCLYYAYFVVCCAYFILSLFFIYAMPILQLCYAYFLVVPILHLSIMCCAYFVVFYAYFISMLCLF